MIRLMRVSIGRDVRLLRAVVVVCKRGTPGQRGQGRVIALSRHTTCHVAVTVVHSTIVGRLLADVGRLRGRLKQRWRLSCPWAIEWSCANA
jgi:hypothetical protein